MTTQFGGQARAQQASCCLRRCWGTCLLASAATDQVSSLNEDPHLSSRKKPTQSESPFKTMSGCFRPSHSPVFVPQSVSLSVSVSVSVPVPVSLFNGLCQCLCVMCSNAPARKVTSCISVAIIVVWPLTHTHTHAQADKQTDRQTDRQKDRQNDKQTDIQTNRQPVCDRQTDCHRQTGRRTDALARAHSRTETRQWPPPDPPQPLRASAAPSTAKTSPARSGPGPPTAALETLCFATQIQRAHLDRLLSYFSPGQPLSLSERCEWYC